MSKIYAMWMLCVKRLVFVLNDENCIQFNACEECLDQEAAGLILKTCDPARWSYIVCFAVKYIFK